MIASFTANEMTKGMLAANGMGTEPSWPKTINPMQLGQDLTCRKDRLGRITITSTARTAPEMAIHHMKTACTAAFSEIKTHAHTMRSESAQRPWQRHAF